MRPSTAILIGLAVVLQYPLWLGKGGWLKVWESDSQLRQQREVNRQLELRNAGLEAETRNLKSGLEAVEERSRFELGMVKPDEIFYQLPQRKKAAVAAEAAPAPAPEAATKTDVAKPESEKEKQ
ncbi:MAG: cell division protein FtsB [Fluviibacter sp.]